MQEETYAARTEANPSPPDSGPAHTRAAGRPAARPCSPAAKSASSGGQVDVEVVPAPDQRGGQLAVRGDDQVPVVLPR